MPKVTTEKRFTRVLKFLMASTVIRIAKLLAIRGFSDEDRQEGWSLLERAAGRHLAVSPSAGVVVDKLRKVVGEVDAWENTWFDVADAALKRQVPAVHQVLFMNLSKVSGNAVLITVKTFLERLDALEEEGGEENEKAMALLEKRGLTEERRAEARALLEKMEVAEPDEEDAVDEEALKAEQEAAIEEMWAWYKDWAKTARTVVKNRNYRIMLGLSTPRSQSSGDEDDDSPSEVAAVG